VGTLELLARSGHEAAIWLAPLAAFALSFFTAMGGISGAFLLLPLQVAILGQATPSVSATNHVFNVVATPGGVWRYFREGRMLWPLTWTISIAALPGAFVGAWVRTAYLPDPRSFKLFAGLVLFSLGCLLLKDVVSHRDAGRRRNVPHRGLERLVRVLRATPRQVSFHYDGQVHRFSPLMIWSLCFLIGIAGGIYGIGGGSMIAPFLVAIVGLPVHSIAGATLLSTFITSLASVAAFQALAPFYPHLPVAPDWSLGLLFGGGGFAGIYLGARCQKYFPPRLVKAILAACALLIAGRYVIGYFQ
jgi:hypothetical protein